MKKVLIIGANSYIGNSFEKYINYKQVSDEDLAKDKIVLDKVSASNGDWERTDFTEYDTILYLAGIVHQREKKEREKDYYRVNKDLAIQVAAKAKKDNIKHFIFMSSASVFGSKATDIKKSTQPLPDSFYGKSKLAAEQEIFKLQDSAFRVAIVRPPMVYGADCKGNFPKLVKLAKIAPIFPDIQNCRSMIYIDNLCEFLRVLIACNGIGYYHPQNAYHICTSNMVKIISNCLGHNIYLTRLFNGLIAFFEKRNSYIKKIFGNNYYDLNIDDGKINPHEYQVLGLKDSIEKSVTR